MSFNYAGSFQTITQYEKFEISWMLGTAAKTLAPGGGGGLNVT